MCNFYRQFLPRLAHIIRPLTDSLSSTKKEFTITPGMLQAVDEVKHAIANATLLVHPVRDTVLSITMDASDTAIAGVLHQHRRGQLQPLSFFSLRLNNAETHYSTFYRKLLAVAVSKKKKKKKKKRLIIITDLKPLTSSIIKSNTTSTWSQRAERNLLFISQFTTDICHDAWESNKVAEAISRPPIPPV